MMSLGHRRQILAIIFLIAMVTIRCASKNYLVVNYQLPPEIQTTGVSEVALSFKDQRAEQTLVTNSAKTALKDFEDNFALIVANGNEDERLVGAFSLCSMIKAVFKQRLEHAGINVVPDDPKRPLTVEILLKDFKIDLVKHKWVVQLTYQANLFKENRFAGGQTITGNAERLRLVASKDAEMILGELISDAVNRLDLDDLFRPAGI